MTDFFNWLGLIYVMVMMIPNIVYAFLNKKDYSTYKEPNLNEKLENFGRGGSILFMMFNIPALTSGYFFDGGLVVYIIVNSVLCILYVSLFFILMKKESMFKVLSLTIIPSLIFLGSAILIQSLPLLICALLFSYNHISISIRNYMKGQEENE